MAPSTLMEEKTLVEVVWHPLLYEAAAGHHMGDRSQLVRFRTHIQVWIWFIANLLLSATWLVIRGLLPSSVRGPIALICVALVRASLLLRFAPFHLDSGAFSSTSMILCEHRSRVFSSRLALSRRSRRISSSSVVWGGSTHLRLPVKVC
jgi:hypothetical protein